MIQITNAISPLKLNGFHRNKSSVVPDKPVFMFSEEQIAKQLTDMREQTEFMQKFRVALALALREIKALRSCPDTARSSGTKSNATAATTLDPLNLLSEKTTEGICPEKDSPINSLRVDKELSNSCVCSQLRRDEYEFLQEFLVKVKSNGLETEISENLDALKLIGNSQKGKQLLKFEKYKQAGETLDNCIRQIDRLKSNVADRKSKTELLFQELLKSDAIRVRRETKLEEKLKEVAEWKTKYESLKTLNEKERKLSHGLRVALSSERKKVKSSEKLARNLEETRKAFFQLKNQAGELMNSLKSKDSEIAELSSKLEAFNTSSEKTATSSQPGDFTSIHGVVQPASNQIAPPTEKKDSYVQTDVFVCDRCSTAKQENINEVKSSFIQNLRDLSSPDASNDLSQHFYAAPSYSVGNNHHSNRYECRDGAKEHQKGPPKDLFRASSHGHPYGRRIYPPYTSPESYRRVSRPPLRRRLHFDYKQQRQQQQIRQSHIIHNVSVNTLLSPIDENDESTDDVMMAQSSPAKTGTKDSISDGNCKQNKQQDISTAPQMTSPQRLHHGHFHSRAQWPQPPHSPPKPTTPSFHVHDSIFENASQTKKLFLDNKSTNKLSEDIRPQELNLPNSHGSQKMTKKNLSPTKEGTSPENSPKSAYLEVGNSPSPSNSRNSSADISESGLVAPPSPLLPNSFIRQKPASEQEINNKTLETGLSDLTPNFKPTERLEPLQFGVAWHPAMNQTDEFTDKASGTPKTSPNAHPPRMNTSPSPRKCDVTKSKSKKVAESGRYVIYKGHKIDVTKFSIHAFRDIIWTLEGGTESAEDFIKFLASLATKLNENPKWKDRHALGDAKDWLELRGLY